MKTIDRIAVILFVLCLLVGSVILPINIIATNKSYYINQFKKCGIYPNENETVSIYHINGSYGNKAALTSSHLDKIAEHTSLFFSNKKDSFELKLDGVLVNGIKQNGVSVFGQEAVTHMLDVRQLFNLLEIISYIIAAVMLSCASLMIFRKESVRKIIFSYSLYAICGIVVAAIAAILIVIIRFLTSGGSLAFDGFFDFLWTDMHHLFFPFSSEKFGGSFFNDTLTELLTLDFFMNTVATIVINVAAILTAWLMSARIIKNK